MKRFKKLNMRRSLKSLLALTFLMTTRQGVKEKMQRVAAETRNHNVYHGIGEDHSAKALRNVRMKAHDNAVKRGFPTFTHRWFERPIFRRQQAELVLHEEVVGPFFCAVSLWAYLSSTESGSKRTFRPEPRLMR
eukprot:4130370-Amphidinium_carterae.4